MQSRLSILTDIPSLGCRIHELSSSQLLEKFIHLSLEEQVLFLAEFVKLFSCNAETANLLQLCSKAECLGGNNIIISQNLNQNINLIHQSVTGLYQRKINLNNYPGTPNPNKSSCPGA